MAKRPMDLRAGGRPGSAGEATRPSVTIQDRVTETEYSERRQRLAGLLAGLRVESGLQALLVTALPNVRYLTGFSGSNALLLVTEDETVLFTDPRYQVQAAGETAVTVTVARGPIEESVAARAAKLRLKRIGFEEARIGYGEWRALGSAFGSKARLIGTRDVVETLRMVKSPAEIELIRNSMRIASAAYESVVLELKAGISELEIAAELEYRMRRGGAEGASFETIVAAADRSAMPHARPSPNRLAANQLLLVDMGALYAGYASDMTRVVHLGKPPRKVKAWYRAVLEAQLAAIDAVRHGVAAGAIDRRARGVLKQHGLEEAFVHSTGHGLGLEIHERPRLGKGDRTRLVEGMAVTVEPGVYFGGLCGIRIEDTVIVRKNGCEVLTPASKELSVI